MGLFGSLSAGVTGLLAQGEAISVISDNLANTNTIGYKNTRTLFDQQVTSSGVSGTLFNAGGVATEFERFQNAQGAFLATQSSTDLALSGNGFFTVVDQREVTNATSFFYTRAGAFSEDNRGFLTTPSGQFLMGWRTESDGTIQDIQNPSPIELQSVGSSARATSEVDLGVNLTSDTDIHAYDTTTTLQTDINAILADPTTSDFVTDVRFFDAQGGSRDVTTAFTKRADNLWDWVMFTDGSNVITDQLGNLGVAGTNAQIGSGTLRFNTNGSLKYVTGDTLDINWAGGVPNGNISLNLGDYTGGYVFDAPPAALDFQDVAGGGNILDLSLDDTDPNAPATIAGNYTIQNLGPVAGGFQLQLTEPDASVHTAVIPATSATRTVDFGNGVTMTASANWDGTTDLLAAANITISAPPLAAKDIGRGTDGVIQFAAPFNTSFANQDGFGSGTLAAVSVDQEGFVNGAFTNGESKKLWKLTVAVFQDSSELEPIGDNLLRETDGSGRPLLKQAGVGGTATVVSGSLEQSTVDIAGEFSNMIVSQRAFQASSKIISTVDQMLTELLQLR